MISQWITYACLLWNNKWIFCWNENREETQKINQIKGCSMKGRSHEPLLNMKKKKRQRNKRKKPYMGRRNKLLQSLSLSLMVLHVRGSVLLASSTSTCSCLCCCCFRFHANAYGTTYWTNTDSYIMAPPFLSFSSPVCKM